MVLQTVLIVILEICSYNSLPIKKILTFHNFNTNSQLLIRMLLIIRLIFLEKRSYKYKSNKQYF